MFLLSMALVEGLIKALKSVTLYQCLCCVGCAPADLAVVQIQSGLHCLSLCPGDSGITQKCRWITSILLTEFWGNLKLGSIGKCMAEDRRFPRSDRGIAARAGKRR